MLLLQGKLRMIEVNIADDKILYFARQTESFLSGKQGLKVISILDLT